MKTPKWEFETGSTSGDPIEIYQEQIVAGETVKCTLAYVQEGQIYSNRDLRIENARKIAATPQLLDFAKLAVSQAHGDMSAEDFRDYIEQEARKVLAIALKDWEP